MTGPGAGSPSDDSTRGDGGESAKSVDDSARRGTSNRADEPSRSEAVRTDGDATRAPAPEPTATNRDRVTIEDDGLVRWFLRTNDGTVVAIRDVASSVAVVAVIGLVLFGISGIWPPLVAVESGSMEPNMHKGDLIFVVDEQRFAGDGATAATGVVTFDSAVDNGHEKFGEPGDVIIFRPEGSEMTTPIIHRAHFWVEEGENWVELYADDDILGATTCDQLTTCPARYDGFITKGDANPGYDQARGGAGTSIVKPEWVTGKGMFRIPWLGHIRLTFDEHLSASIVSAAPGVSPATAPTESAGPFPAGGLGFATVGTATLAVAGWRRNGR